MILKMLIAGLCVSSLLLLMIAGAFHIGAVSERAHRASQCKPVPHHQWLCSSGVGP